MHYTDEQKALKDLVRKFAEHEIKPYVREMDEKSEFKRDVIKALGELALTGIMIPEEYGGIGEGYLTNIIFIEELSRVSAAYGAAMCVHSLCYMAILEYGNEEQKRKYLPELASGNMLGAWALTESNAGSDAASLRTSAVRDGNYYIFNGTKQWITNGGEADLYITMVKTDPKKRTKGISAFIIEKGIDGLSFGKNEDKMGMRASPTRNLIFEDCRVPEKNLLGKEGEGFEITMNELDGGRINNAALTLGIAQGALEAAIDYSKEREQFNQRICDFQGIQFMLADMATDVETARAITEKAAYYKDNLLPVTLLASIAKMYSADVAMRVTTNAVQIFGGYGYMKDYPVEQFMRDAKLFQITEGTNQIQRVIIAKNLLK
jgi:acyl-CoA dehydrogenase